MYWEYNINIHKNCVIKINTYERVEKMNSIEQFLEPRDIYEKIGGNASELSQEEHGFICGLIKKYRLERIVELGVSGGGTSVLVLNCLQKLGMNDTKMFSIDLSRTYHFNTEKQCGFQIEEAREYLENIDNHTLILGKTLPEVIENITEEGKIDFLILDTTHYLPGELLDFAIALPFLTDNAVIVLDDISFWFEGENRWAFATKILFDLCIAEKYYAQTPDGFPKVAAFRLADKSSMWQKNLFDALSMPWSYYDKNQISFYKKIVSRYFSSEIQESFNKAVEINAQAIEKKKNIKPIIKYIMEKCKNVERVYIYGCGQRGRALLYFLEKNGINVDGMIVSDDRSKQQVNDFDTEILHISEVSMKNEPLILVAAADDEIRQNLDNLNIKYYDIPNYVFPFIKGYYEIMS